MTSASAGRISKPASVVRLRGKPASGFVAWWLWRTIYLCKLPGFAKKLRVALEWALDLFFHKDFVQYLRAASARQLFPIDDSALPQRVECEPAKPNA